MTTPQPSTRREFLHQGVSLVGLGATVPAFLVKSAFALAGSPQAGRGQAGPAPQAERTLVVLQLAGGNDGLNTVVPFRDDRYHQLRPQLRLMPDEVLRIHENLGLHPAATGLRALLDDARLTIVQGVGYPNPNRSHFKSMDIWHTASPNGRRHDGWLGRYFDNECAGQGPCDPMRALALMPEAPLAVRGRSFAPTAFESPDALRLRRVTRGGKGGEAIDRLNASPGSDHADQTLSALDFLRRTALNARVGAERIRGTAGTARVARRFPQTGLGRSLALVARMIASEMPTRVFYVSMGGFDTHSRQRERHRRLMAELGDALKALVDALAATGHLDRTLVITFSEFGRRVAENASGGTDHGAAAPMFLLGSRVKAGVIGSDPDLLHLDRGDVAHGVDFRQVYATVLRDWLGVDPQPILGGRFKPLDLIQR